MKKKGNRLFRGKNKVYPCPRINVDIVNLNFNSNLVTNYEMLLPELKFVTIINPITQLLSDYKRVIPIERRRNNSNNPFGYKSKVPLTIITNI